MAQPAASRMMSFSDPEAAMGGHGSSPAGSSTSTSSPPEQRGASSSSSNPTAQEQVEKQMQRASSNAASATASTPSAAKVAEAKRAWGKSLFLVMLACHLAWLHIHIRVFGQLAMSFIYGAWSSTNRKVLIIGDDVALGVGDWVTIFTQPGLQGRFNKVLNKDVASRIVGRGVLWTAFTSAKAGSVSEDWLPVTQMSAEQKIRFAALNGALGRNGKQIPKGRRGDRFDGLDDVAMLKAEGITVQDAMSLKGASLFDKCFNPNVGTHKDADIVVVVVGSKDRCTILETVQNISKLSSELLKLGKHVIVTTISLPPSSFSANKEVLTRFRDRNEAMAHMVGGMQSLEKMDDRNRSAVTFGLGPMSSAAKGTAASTLTHRGGAADAGAAAASSSAAVGGHRIVLSRVAESLTQDQCYRFEGKAFNSYGYNRAADVVMQSLTPMMRQIDGKKEGPRTKRME